MFIFPIIYLFSIIYTIKEFLKGNRNAFLIFLIFGLSIYTTAMSVTYKLGFVESITIFQPIKELFIIVLLIWCILEYKEKLTFHSIDYVLLFYFTYILIYSLIPFGDQSLKERLLSLKSSTFFILVYFVGRFFNLKTLSINKYFFYILILAIAAAIVVLFEVTFNLHLQTESNYSEYIYHFFNLEPTGNYGLSWTFETGAGAKRFASFFANPLEHAAATIISISVLIAFYTKEDYQFKPDNFGLIAMLATFISIVFALSRASFASYFILIYAYGWLVNKKYIPKIAHYIVFIVVAYFLYLIYNSYDKNSDVSEWIIKTIDFSDSSSVGHLVEWIAGLTSIYEHPFGIGMGSSGRVASTFGENVGGENQFIIIGVQVGVIALSLYIYIYVAIIRAAKYWYYRLAGKEKMVCLAVLLIKIGFLIPLLTSEIETSSYIAYITWLLTGLFINMISNKPKSKEVEFSAINTRS